MTQQKKKQHNYLQVIALFHSTSHHSHHLSQIYCIWLYQNRRPVLQVLQVYIINKINIKHDSNMETTADRSLTLRYWLRAGIRLESITKSNQSVAVKSVVVRIYTLIINSALDELSEAIQRHQTFEHQHLSVVNYSIGWWSTSRFLTLSAIITSRTD